MSSKRPANQLEPLTNGRSKSLGEPAQIWSHLARSLERGLSGSPAKIE